MKVSITGGKNIIRYVSDKFITALIIDRPLAINWPDMAGSIGEYYAVSGYSKDERECLTGWLNEVLKNDDNDQIVKHVISFLQLFSNGEYRLSFDTLKLNDSVFITDEKIIREEHIGNEEEFTCEYYPADEGHFFFTRPFKMIDNERVQFYENEIKAGCRPTVLIYQGEFPQTHLLGPSYVLDGHHKLEAYKNLDIDIPAMIITQVLADGNTFESDLLPLCYPFLKPAEFNHIIYHNAKIYTEQNEFSALSNAAIDRHLSTARHHISWDINQLLIRACQSADPSIDNWLNERLDAVSRNANISNGVNFYIKGYSQQHQCEEWNSFPIYKISDIKKWLTVVRQY